MNGLWLMSLISATTAIHAANWVAVKHIDGANFIPSVFRIGLWVLPLTYLSTVGFSIFYGMGATRMPYALLAILATATSLLVSLLITVLVQKVTPSPIQLTGTCLLIAGVGLILFDRLT